MKATLAPEIEKLRTAGPKDGGPYGAFKLVHPRTGRSLVVIASDGRDWLESKKPLPPPVWEHVSVSSKFGIPMWIEMAWVKEQFFNDDEWVVEFHPAKIDHINIHPNVLHLWRCPSAQFPVPPKECV